jgi:hypothetical protein
LTTTPAFARLRARQVKYRMGKDLQEDGSED